MATNSKCECDSEGHFLSQWSTLLAHKSEAEVTLMEAKIQLSF